MGPGGPSRRTVLKRIAGASAVAGLSGTAAARSDDTRRRREPAGRQPTDRAALEDAAIVRRPGADVREAVGGLWWLLTVDRGRLDDLLAKGVAGGRLRGYTDTLTDLRSTYEVELRTEREDWYEYHLVDSGVEPLARRGDGQLSTAGEIASMVNSGLAQESDAAVEPQYFNSGHEDMVAASLGYFDLYSWEETYLMEGVIEPDDHDITPGEKCFNCSDSWFNFELVWDPFSEEDPQELSAEQRRLKEQIERDGLSAVDVPGKGALEDWLLDQITDINDSAAPHHMYLDDELELGPIVIPALGVLNPWEVEVSGAAHIEAQYHVDEADRSWGVYERELGRALHFLQDCSLPMHAGAVLEQTGITDIDFEFPLPDPNPKGAEHSAHEYYVQNNWEDGDDIIGNFKLYFDSYRDRAKWAGSAEETVVEMASYAGQYADQILEEIIEKGPDNKDDWDYSTVESPTKLCVDDAGKYTRGMMDQLLDSTTDLEYPPY